MPGLYAGAYPAVMRRVSRVARDIDGADEPLVSYFSDRQIWYVDRGNGMHKLYPYRNTEPVQKQLAQAAVDGSTR